jgi:leucyl aminopeptidase
MKMTFTTRKNLSSIPITPITKSNLTKQKKLPESSKIEWFNKVGFSAVPGTTCYFPGSKTQGLEIFLGVEESDEPGGDIWDLAGLPKQLPKGKYFLNKELSPAAATRACIGWALGNYIFNKYKKHPKSLAELVWPNGADKKDVIRVSAGIGLTRDLINTPANDLGPQDLAKISREIAKNFKAKISVISGQNLLRQNYPSVHAVGRASSSQPCLIDITWGKVSAPKVTLIGKGVCFDSGGLDIKPAAGMLNMKKDMGGAAQVLGLSHMIMDAGLPIRLRVLIPAVENAISGNAFRPRDVLQTRKGLTVEVGNTDAEGRLVLSDALTEASRDKPSMIIDFATLTGAARVAMGTDIPALFCNNDELANSLLNYGAETEDPLWRLPLWKGYRSMLDSKIADLSSTGTTPFGGAITAALFLEHFVDANIPWAHIDLMAYNNHSRPGRPEGGEAQGIRGIYTMLKDRFG